MTDLTFTPSPWMLEQLHRAHGITEMSFRSTENTGGNFMHDLYDLPDGRILVFYENGMLLCKSFLHWIDSDWAEVIPFDMQGADYLEDAISIDDLEQIWADNCELIFGEVGSADELLSKHEGQISEDHRNWVIDFINTWDEMEEEEREFNERTGWGGRL